MFWWHFTLALATFFTVTCNIHFFNTKWNKYDEQYHSFGHFSESERLSMLEKTKDMFHFGYDNYLKYAFPLDELDPIHCTGRGPDYENPSNININDVLGDYALTLIDSLDTLAIMGNISEFQRAVQLVIDHVSFDRPSTVQVFEATIRVLGGLISAHLLIKDDQQHFGHLSPPDYDGELLYMAHDLAVRLLPAFQHTNTGIPFPRVNLQDGVPEGGIEETCPAGAGSLLIEFGLLSHLLQDPTYESTARRAIKALWSYRSNVTGLFGNAIHIHSGKWLGTMSGVGAGLDSFFEYMLKSFILFGEKKDLKMFNESYETIKYYLRKGRRDCNNGTGFPPIYVNVNMKTGEILNNWIDALQAAWPGVQVLNGDIEEAICAHALYYAIWQRYGALPERYNWHLKSPDVFFYPLRPELVESTYLLYQATKNPFYMHVGKSILESLNNHTKVKCGYATIHNVNEKDLEDRMESFFLSETCKYLYLLFDTKNPVNQHAEYYMFSTEGHVIPLSKSLRKKPWERDMPKSEIEEPNPQEPEDMSVTVDARDAYTNQSCDSIPEERRFFLPIQSRYLQQVEALVGLT